MAKKALTKADLRVLKVKQILRKKRKRKPKTIFQRAKISSRLAKAIKDNSKRNKQLNTRANVGMTEPERLVKAILVEHEIEFQREYEIMGKFYDFYLPEKNVLIEVDGIYWHARDAGKLDYRQIKQRIEDSYKNSIAKASKKALVRIWEDEVSEGHVIRAIQEASDALDRRNKK